MPHPLHPREVCVSTQLPAPPCLGGCRSEGSLSPALPSQWVLRLPTSFCRWMRRDDGKEESGSAEWKCQGGCGMRESGEGKGVPRAPGSSYRLCQMSLSHI